MEPVNRRKKKTDFSQESNYSVMFFSFPPLSYLGFNSFDVRKCVKRKIKGLI